MIDLAHNLTDDHTDQGAINVLWMVQQKASITFLPWDQYSNGLLYFGLKLARNPVVIHANWIKKSEMKEHCLKLSGNWYLSEETCQERVSSVDFAVSSPINKTKQSVVESPGHSVDHFI